MEVSDRLTIKVEDDIFSLHFNWFIWTLLFFFLIFLVVLGVEDDRHIESRHMERSSADGKPGSVHGVKSKYKATCFDSSNEA